MSHRTYRAAGTVALCLAATLFVLAAITWAYKGIAFSGVAALVGTVLLIAAAALKDHQHWSEHHEKHGFWYEVTKDFVGPLVIAGAGLYFGYQLEKQRGLEAENQSKATILRQMMTSRNGPDVAFFTAVGEQLTTHLQHWAKLRQEIDLRKDATEETKNAMREEAVFDEEAINFFYGMFRAARIDFLATKGYVLYPRIWMEVAFERLTQHVNDRFLGASEQDWQVSAQEQAALYQYFGASKAMYSASSRHGTLTGRTCLISCQTWTNTSNRMRRGVLPTRRQAQLSCKKALPTFKSDCVTTSRIQTKSSRSLMPLKG
jgi:hypothetical protein